MGVSFEVTRPTTSWFIALLDGLSGGLSADYRGKLPEVVVINPTGERRVLEVLDTKEEADAREATIRDDFATLDLADWCDRYEVPKSFFDGM